TSRQHHPLPVRRERDGGTPGGERSESGDVEPLRGPGPRGVELRQSEHQPRAGSCAVPAVPQLLLHSRGGFLIMATRPNFGILPHVGGPMRITYLVLALGGMAVVAACDLPNEPNLNNPSLGDFSTISDLPHLQALVTGVLRGDRVQNEDEIIYGSTI